MNKEKNIRERLEMAKDYSRRNCQYIYNKNNYSGYNSISNEPVKNTCSCKKDFTTSLKLILNPILKNMIDLTSFTLIGKNFTTFKDQTVLKSIDNCNNGLIKYEDPGEPIGSNFTLTTVCDLCAVSFYLTQDMMTAYNKVKFMNAIKRTIPSIDPKSICCDKNNESSCNAVKASFLLNAIGPINISVSSSAYKIPFKGYTVITVTNNIAWLINDDYKVLIICLDNLERLG